ncbi:MAG: DUF296 domain-containing protein [Kiritimatiellae bacterium]|nr:DUF296 domain-containing protein [Kiritimatiellia bacterium]
MKATRIGQHWMLRLARGEPLIDALSRFVQTEAIPCGFFWGIGMLDNAELGLYDCAEKQFHKRTFQGPLEIAAMQGKIERGERGPQVHVHAVVSDRNMTPSGGHLVGGTVGALCEVFMTVPER